MTTTINLLYVTQVHHSLIIHLHPHPLSVICNNEHIPCFTPIPAAATTAAGRLWLADKITGSYSYCTEVSAATVYELPEKQRNDLLLRHSLTSKHKFELVCYPCCRCRNYTITNGTQFTCRRRFIVGHSDGQGSESAFTLLLLIKESKKYEKICMENGYPIPLNTHSSAEGEQVTWLWLAELLQVVIRRVIRTLLKIRYCCCCWWYSNRT